MIEIVEPGPLATVQDRGRYGCAWFGVARSGAFDHAAHDLANRLVGNPVEAATIEFTMGGLVILVRETATVSITGAQAPAFDWGVPVTVPPGTEIRFGRPRGGLRSYLAVRGGFALPSVLGSCSTDTLGGVGPPILVAGMRLPIGPQPAAATSEVAAPSRPPRSRIRVLAGPGADWFDPGALHVLANSSWVAGPDSNRVGVRLSGPQLRRARDGELPSEPTLPGAIQVPPSGQPILLGPDAPVTGGYPVIGVCRRADLDIAAQLRPGDPIGFVIVDLR